MTRYVMASKLFNYPDYIHKDLVLPKVLFVQNNCPKDKFYITSNNENLIDDKSFDKLIEEAIVKVREKPKIVKNKSKKNLKNKNKKATRRKKKL